VADDLMHTSKMIHLRPEDELQEVIKGQKTITTTKLQKLLEPLLEKLWWQEETLNRNVVSIRELSHKVNRSAQEVRRKDKVIEKRVQVSSSWESRAQSAEALLKQRDANAQRSSEAYNILLKEKRILEEQLNRAKKVIAGLEMDARIAKLGGGR